MEPLETPRQATKQWIPMRNRISFGSSVPGNPSEPNPNGFDQRPLGKAPEIQLDDGRDSGSRIQRREGLWHPVCDPIRKIPAKIKSLRKYSCSSDLESYARDGCKSPCNRPTPPNPAIQPNRPLEYSPHFRISAFSVSVLPQYPLLPRNPLFPASGPATSAFSGPQPKSNFLATKPSRDL